MNSLKTTKAALLLIFASCAYAEEPKAAYVPETTTTSEVFRSRVLKVHHFIEADFEYLAYTIDWRGREVVVSATAIGEILKEGDTIRCMMRAMPVAVGEGKKAAITFSILSSGGGSTDAVRLQAVADEVRRRRAERGATAAEKQAEDAPSR